MLHRSSAAGGDGPLAIKRVPGLPGRDRHGRRVASLADRPILPIRERPSPGI